jgi:hypothetical protein
MKNKSTHSKKEEAARQDADDSDQMQAGQDEFTE